MLTVKVEKSVKSKSLAEIAQSHWESIMIQTLAREKRCQDTQLMKNKEFSYDTHLLQKWIKQYKLGHIRQAAI